MRVFKIEVMGNVLQWELLYKGTSHIVSEPRDLHVSYCIRIQVVDLHVSYCIRIQVVVMRGVLCLQEVLSLMGQLEYEPNIQTFGCMAMGCARRQDGLQLLRDMEVTHDIVCPWRGHRVTAEVYCY